MFFIVKVISKLNLGHHDKFEIEFKKISRRSLRSPDNAELVRAAMDTRGEILFTGESPVAQWLKHPTRSRRVVGSNPIWISDFFRVLFTFNIMLLFYL